MVLDWFRTGACFDLFPVSCATPAKKTGTVILIKKRSNMVLFKNSLVKIHYHLLNFCYQVQFSLFII